MKLIILLAFGLVLCKSEGKKDPRDYTDADIYKLDEQWEEEGEIDEGDLPEHRRPSQPVDFSKVDPSDPEGMLKMTKRHKTLMMFATISGDPTEAESDEISGLWQSMLYNANIEITRFMVSSNRVLIRLTDGSYAYEIKDFLVQQDRCENVSIEGKDYPGKASPKYKDTNDKKEKPKSKSKNAKKDKSKPKDNKKGKTAEKKKSSEKSSKSKKEEL